MKQIRIPLQDVFSYRVVTALPPPIHVARAGKTINTRLNRLVRLCLERGIDLYNNGARHLLGR
ncbi:MAG: hypothetical protein LM583_02725 [Desulfurococcaceae archaeon]|nr:hypothetical protein [Desulfurococcaceae archaeon]